MEDVIGVLAALAFIAIAIIRAIMSGRRSQAQRAASRAGGDDEPVHKASEEELRRFLRSLGVDAGPADRPQAGSEADGQETQVRRGSGAEPSAPGVTPAATRAREAHRAPTTVQAARRARPPRPPAPEAGVDPYATQRRVKDADAPAGFGRRSGLPPQQAEDYFGIGPTVEEALQRDRAPDVVSAEAANEAAILGGAAVRRVGLARRSTATAAGAAAVAAGMVERVRERGIDIPTLDRRGLRQAIVLSEILSPPVALREQKTHYRPTEGRRSLDGAAFAR